MYYQDYNHSQATILLMFVPLHLSQKVLSSLVFYWFSSLVSIAKQSPDEATFICWFLLGLCLVLGPSEVQEPPLSFIVFHIQCSDSMAKKLKMQFTYK